MKQNKNIDNGCLANKVPVSDIVKSLLIREGDVLGQHFRQYLEVAKDVYRDLNLYAIRETRRYMIEVNKKTNSIKLPKDCLMWSSIQVPDECGQLLPLLQNTNLTGDIVDLNLANDCGCQCNCQSELCGSLKHYEVIHKTIMAPMPNGEQQGFECMERKTIYPNGDYYLEWTEPVVKYDGDQHVATELESKTEFICRLEVEACGCVKDCPANREMITGSCGAGFFPYECGCPSCPPVMPNATYGYEEFGDTICFDSAFCYDYVLLRYYVEQKGSSFMVPIIAKTAMIRGIMFEMLPYQPGSGYTALALQRRQVQFERLYKEERKRLFRLINRFSLKNFYERTLGQRRMPGPGWHLSYQTWNY